MIGKKTSIKSLKAKALDQVKVLKQTCPRHPHQHMISIAGGKPVCPIEAQQNINKKSNQQANKIYSNAKQNSRKFHYQYFKQILKNDSLVGDASLFNANFSDFYVGHTGSLLAKVKQRTMTEALKYCQANTPHNVLLVGKPGRGKSHLAMSILKFVNQNADKHLNHGNTSCLFVNITDLMNRIYSAIASGQTAKIHKFVLEMSNVYLLTLDDLGIENPINNQGQTTYAQTVLYSILTARQGKRTIFTTNLSSAKLKTLYNEQMLSRILAGSYYHIIKFSNQIDDYRLRLRRD